MNTIIFSIHWWPVSAISIAEIIDFFRGICWLAIIFLLRKDLALLDVLTLGKDQAINLGVDYDKSIRRLLLGVTLSIAVATAMVGPFHWD